MSPAISSRGGVRERPKSSLTGPLMGHVTNSMQSEITFAVLCDIMLRQFSTGACLYKVAGLLAEVIVAQSKICPPPYINATIIL